MLTEHSQLVTICSFGNQFISGLSDSVDLSNHSVFRHVERIMFANGPRTDDLPTPIYAAVDQWLLDLKIRGATRLRVVSIPYRNELPDRVVAGFANGATWGALVELPTHKEIWISEWTLTPEPRVNKDKVWNVILWRYSARGLECGEHTLGEAIAQCQSAVDAVIDFTHRAELAFWHDWYQRAKSVLEADHVEHGQFLPSTDYHEDAHRLINFADAAWAFGAMGSYNDVVLHDELLKQEYQTTADQLYRALIVGMQTAVNEGFIGHASLRKNETSKWFSKFFGLK